MILSWTDKAWEDYLFWQKQDRKIFDLKNPKFAVVNSHFVSEKEYRL